MIAGILAADKVIPCSVSVVATKQSVANVRPLINYPKLSLITKRRSKAKPNSLIFAWGKLMPMVDLMG